jgi:pimeloyl-ACP methyl ester carboxylesterase
LAFAGLTSASTIDLPQARLATGTAISSCFRQIGGVVGIAGLVAVLGTPGPRALVPAFERAWLLMACTGLGAALLACGLPARRRSDRSDLAQRRGARRAIDLPGVARNEIFLHGHRIVYRVAGSGPALVLVHGLFDNSLTWRKVIPALARSHTVIAPDLFGHGESDAPVDADYSLGGHAGTLRDLLEVLGHHRVTLVGHSLGAGIAMSFAYRYPGRVHRLALISSGGFGREVHPVLRALSLPGAGPALRLLTARPTLDLLAWLARLARTAGARRPARSARRLRVTLASLGDRGRRVAMIRTLRSVIGFRGQCVSALNRLYALRRFPTLVVWGTGDRVIPAHHASAALAFNPGAELVLLDGVGHVPHLSRGEFVADRLSSFINEAPARATIAADSRVRGPRSARRPLPSPAAAAEATI